MLPWVSAILNSLALSQLFYQNQCGSRLFYPRSMQEIKQSQGDFPGLIGCKFRERGLQIFTICFGTRASVFNSRLTRLGKQVIISTCGVVGEQHAIVSSVWARVRGSRKHTHTQTHMQTHADQYPTTTYSYVCTQTLTLHRPDIHVHTLMQTLLQTESSAHTVRNTHTDRDTHVGTH